MNDTDSGQTVQSIAPGADEGEVVAPVLVGDPVVDELLLSVDLVDRAHRTGGRDAEVG